MPQGEHDTSFMLAVALETHVPLIWKEKMAYGKLLMRQRWKSTL